MLGAAAAAEEDVQHPPDVGTFQEDDWNIEGHA